MHSILPLLFDILAKRPIEISRKFLINFTKASKKSISNESKKNCKILNFSSEWNYTEVLKEISKLNAKVFKNLFVFIINETETESTTDDESTSNEKKIIEIEEVLKRFCEDRPIIVQITTNNTKIFMRNGKHSHFVEIEQTKRENEKVEDFPSFLRWFLGEKILKTQSGVFSKLQNPDLLTLRFLSNFSLPLETSFPILLNIAEKSTKAQFLAALDVSFEDDGRVLNTIQSKFITKTFGRDKSVLRSAIANQNDEILKFLISYCPHLIQKLSKRHQMEIGRELIKKQNFELFCNLLEFCDFVFPKDLNIKLYKHERLEKIILERNNFHTAIENENYEDIHKFKETSNLKYVFNENNNTALYAALSARKFDFYFHLMSLGYKENDCEDLIYNLTDEESTQMRKRKIARMKENVKKSQADVSKAVELLTARSKIYGEEIVEQRKKIREWYEAITKIEFGSSLLNAVAQCESLQVVFDFGHDDVACVDLDSPDANGIMYPRSKLVIIGAKYTTPEQEQMIKGYLAHELFHYVMRITFDNAEQPYYNKNDKRYEIYRKIVTKLMNHFIIEDDDEIIATKNEDDCDEIISSVFRVYDNDEFDAELIVRMIQIFARYDDDSVKVDQLKIKYKELYEFLKTYVIPVLDILNLKERDMVKLFNKFSNLMPSIAKQNCKFSIPKGIETLLNKKLAIVTTNVPKLLLNDIYNNLFATEGYIVDGRNVFVSQENIISSSILKDFKEILTEIENLKIFVDFSNEICLKFSITNSSNFIFIVANEQQSTKLAGVLKNQQLSPEELTINYDWNDLNEITQKRLLKSTLNFQNNPEVSLFELLKFAPNLSTIIDAEVLNAILHDLEILVNMEITASDHFDYIFRNRTFIWNNQQITQDQLLEKSKGQKFVLISDVAGTGKSWAMRKMMKEMIKFNTTKWASFVELKTFIPIFKEYKEKSEVPNFHDFLLKEILDRKSKFEVEIFKLQYATGNCLIFLDGFDEIAPDCADVVKELISTFKSNGTNQLWITVRDLFEIELQEKLGASFICKLVDLQSEDGIELIAVMWRLNDLKKLKNINFEENVLKSEEFASYKTLAAEILMKMPTDDMADIGLPLLYKMIAEVTKDSKSKSLDENINSYQLYKQFWDISFEMWYKEKGELREQVHKESQQLVINSAKLHQLKAVQKILPGKSSYCDLDPDDEEEWTEVDLVGCGLMTKKGDDFFFIHETFGEFFVAQFIVRILSNKRVDANVFELIKEVIINPKHQVIRKFLNEGVLVKKISDNIEEKAKQLVKKVDRNLKNFRNFHEIFTKMLQGFDEIGKFIFLVLKNWNYEKFVEILAENIIEISEKGQKNFIDLIMSIIDIPAIKDVAKKSAEQISPNFIQELLRFTNKFGENIFFWLIKMNISKEKFDKFIRVLQEFLSSTEITNIIMESNNAGESIFHILIRFDSPEKLEIFWTQIENFLLGNDFKRLLLKNILANSHTVLHHAAFYASQVEIHKTLWRLLWKTYESDKEGLKDFLLQRDLNKSNPIQLFLKINNPSILELTLNELKDNLRKLQLKEILTSKGFDGYNLFLYATRYSQHIKVHRILWQFLIDSVDSNENIFDILSEKDFYGYNFLHFVARYSSVDIFNFYIQEMKNVLTIEQIRQLLSSLNKSERNILQRTAQFQRDLEFSENLFQILREYFISSEIFKFIKHRDVFGDNYLSDCIRYSTKDIIDMIVNVITIEINLGDESIQKLRNSIENQILNTSTQEDAKTLSLNWINEEESSFFNEVTKAVDIKVDMTIFDKFDDLEALALYPSENIHKACWTHLQQKYQNSESKLKDFLQQKNIFGSPFMHQVLKNENSQIINLTLDMLKQNLSTADLKEVLKSSNGMSRNLLQSASCMTVSSEVYDQLWTFMRNELLTSELLDILGSVDNDGNNWFLTMADFCTEQVSECRWNQIEELINESNKTQIIEMIKRQNDIGLNIFHICVTSPSKSGAKLEIFWRRIEKFFGSKSDFKDLVAQKTSSYHRTILSEITFSSKDLEFHKTVWKLISGTFEDREELKNFVLQSDRFKNNFLHFLVQFNESDIIEFTLETLQNIFNPSQFREVLLAKGFENYNLLHYALRYIRNIKVHKILWKISSTSDILPQILADVDADGWKIFHFASLNTTTEILDYIHDQLKVFNKREIIKQTILSIDKFGDTCLILAASGNKDVKFHESLWKLLHDFVDKDDILESVKHVGKNGNNFLQAIVAFNVKEVIELTWKEIKALMTENEQEEYLKRRNNNGLNLIGIAAKFNREAEIISLVKGFMKNQ